MVILEMVKMSIRWSGVTLLYSIRKQPKTIHSVANVRFYGKMTKVRWSKVDNYKEEKLKYLKKGILKGIKKINWKNFQNHNGIIE